MEEFDFSEYPLMDWYIAGGESVEIGYDEKDARPFDVNWAINILRKVIGDGFVENLANRGLVFNPEVIALQ